MSTAEAERPQDDYALGRTPQEYERLRAQARVWESATGRLFDQVALAPGATCLDAGCGPGETMRLMAQRVGTSGQVTGVDVDAPLGAQAVAMLHAAGHRQCDFARVDLTVGEPVPGAPFEFVYARLLLYHLPQRVTVLKRLWDAVAPGGHLLVQDYDMRGSGVLPTLASMDECRPRGGRRVLGRRLRHARRRTPAGAVRAGGDRPARQHRRRRTAGAARRCPTDVHGRVPFRVAGRDRPRHHHRATAAASLSEIAHDAQRFPDRPTLWPLLIGAWKRKPAPAAFAGPAVPARSAR